MKTRAAMGLAGVLLTMSAPIVSGARAQDLEKLAMARVRLTTDAGLTQGCGRIGSVHVITASAKRMLVCSIIPRSRTSGWRADTPYFVAKNSGMHSCRSRRTRAPNNRGRIAANTSESGMVLTWIRS